MKIRKLPVASFVSSFARGKIRPGKENRIVIAGFGLGFLINLALWLAVILKFAGSKEAIPLDYDIYFGISSIGPWTRLLRLPAVGLSVLALNLFFVLKFSKRDRFIGYFLALSALLVQAMLLFKGILVINL